MADELQKNLPAPDIFTIPFALIEEWGDIPLNERLNVPLARQDIDHLLVGLIKALDAQSTLERMVVEWSQGKVESANETLAEFRRQNADAQNHVRQLAAAIMATVLKERRK